MDPRVLLNPKSLKKGGSQNESQKKVSRKAAAGDSHLSPLPSHSPQPSDRSVPRSSSLAASPRLHSLPYTVRSYDPRALLHPRGTRRPAISDVRPSHKAVATPTMSSDGVTAAGSEAQVNGSRDSQTNDGASLGNLQAESIPEISSEIPPSPPQDTESTESNSKRLLESLYGVETRNEQPRKKVKIAQNGDVKETKANNLSSYQSSGVIGDYMKQNSDAENQGAITKDVVDLTKDDDDDDEVQIISARSTEDEEVCLGRLFLLFEAYIVPKPAKIAAVYSPNNKWPAIKCEMVRKPENARNSVIDLLDPFERAFAKVDARSAVALATAMDVFKGLRFQPLVLPRTKRADEWPHQECSYTINIQTNIYARRGDVERIGKLLGQHNLWLVTPAMPDKNVPIVNPHANRKTRVQMKVSAPSHPGTVLPDDRTNEEVCQQVASMIDEWSKKYDRDIPETDAPASVKTQLLPHQKQALTFMLNREKPRTYDDEDDSITLSLWRKKMSSAKGIVYEELVSGIRLREEPDQVFGGLLADVMGLGKTLEALSLVATTAEEAGKFGKQQPNRRNTEDANVRAHAKGTLIVCPTSTVQNWDNQIREHLDTTQLTHYVYHGQNRTNNAFDLKIFDVVVTTYGTVASEFRTGSSPLQQLKWFRIILDEAHTIREPKAQQSQACYALPAQRRWCLTGTPIQNRMSDLGSLTRFLRLYPYQDAASFNQYIGGKARPDDAMYLDKLRLFVDSFSLRRLRDKIDLPERKDIVVNLKFSIEEQKMHDHFKEKAMIRIEELIASKDKKSGVHLHMLKGITTLRLICAHGRDLLKDQDLKELQGMTAAEAINLDEEEDLRTINKQQAYENFNLMAEADQDFCMECDSKLTDETPQATVAEDSGVRCYVLPCLDTLCVDCFGKQKGLFDAMEDNCTVECPFCGLNVAAQYVAIDATVTETVDTLPDDRLNGVHDSNHIKYTGPKTKAKALLEDIAKMKVESKLLEENGERPLKCVVFSEFTSNLGLIERALRKMGYKFVRVDGTMTLSTRRKVLDAFDVDDSITILLASIKAAGQGLNLTAASRAFIMEPMWNPAAEAQAVDRIYRIGQKRDVVIKRYQIDDSIEVKIVELARKKQMMAGMAMDAHNHKLSKSARRAQNLKDIVALFK